MQSRKHFKHKYTLHYNKYMLGLQHSHVKTTMKHWHLTHAVKQYHELESEIKSEGSSLLSYLTVGQRPEA